MSHRTSIKHNMKKSSDKNKWYIQLKHTMDYCSSKHWTFASIRHRNLPETPRFLVNRARSILALVQEIRRTFFRCYAPQNFHRDGFWPAKVVTVKTGLRWAGHGPEVAREVVWTQVQPTDRFATRPGQGFLL